MVPIVQEQVTMLPETLKTYKILHPKKKKFLVAYKNTDCNITKSCKEAGVHRTTYYEWLEGDKDFALALMDVELELNDEIEGGLKDEAKNRNMTAVIFYLKNKHPNYKEQRGQVNIQVNNNMSEVADAVKGILGSLK